MACSRVSEYEVVAGTRAVWLIPSLRNSHCLDTRARAHSSDARPSRHSAACHLWLLDHAPLGAGLVERFFAHP
jgi:hypothetical protein